MLKGQLSGVPWPGYSWIPFIFQPALWVLQQPHNHSSPIIFLPSTTQPHQSTEMTIGSAASHKVTCPPCLFQLPPWENVNRSTALINSM